jgi:hypothetical protein
MFDKGSNKKAEVSPWFLAAFVIFTGGTALFLLQKKEIARLEQLIGAQAPLPEDKEEKF